MKQIEQIKDWVFRQVHGKNLVYNACWEDPRCDRQLLEFQNDSQVVMITSAGCNALEYLLDGPAQIHCVDVNYRQNSLLHLKLASLQTLDFEDHFQLFGDGFHPQSREIYTEKLRPLLPDFAQTYWDKKIFFFNGKGPRKSFYHYGTSGVFAWMADKYLRSRKSLHQKIHQLWECQSMEEQAGLYLQVEEQLLNRILQWFVNRHLVMSLLGVPRSQQELFMQEYERGALGYIQERLRNVFLKLPASENYFYRVYLEGAYSRKCCPEYLKADSAAIITDRLDHIQTHTTTLARFLRENPGPYSHFILLDHQDWLAANSMEALHEEWRLILKNSRPGTRILLRSAAEEVDFFPDFVKERVSFEQEKTAQTHLLDRVGTYASVYMAIVN